MFRKVKPQITQPRLLMIARFTIFWVLVFLVVSTSLTHSQNGQSEYICGVTGHAPSHLFSSPQDIFFDRCHEESFVCDSGGYQVVVFDSKGFPLYSFDHPFRRNRGEEKILRGCVT